MNVGGERSLYQLERRVTHCNRRHLDDCTCRRVFCRVRPLLPREVASGARPCLELGGAIGGREDVRLNDKSFSFDGVFGPGTEEEKLYQRAVSPLVEQGISGLNATVLACKRATCRQIVWQNPTETLPRRDVTTRPHHAWCNPHCQNIMIPQGYSPSLSYVLWLVYFISQDGQTGSGKTFTMGSSDVPHPGGDAAPACFEPGRSYPSRAFGPLCSCR